MSQKTESIVLGGGCFWCLEAAYQLVKGVTSVVPGYAGGLADDAHYEVVSSGTTGHAEVVQVRYDSTVLSLETVLAIFWSLHDPTSLNRQGADVGSQYASTIFYDGDEQKRVVEVSRNEAQKQLSDPIVTRIEPLVKFYEAEAYHHNYFQTHPEASYCQVVIDPKLRKLREHFAPLLRR